MYLLEKFPTKSIREISEEVFLRFSGEFPDKFLKSFPNDSLW